MAELTCPASSDRGAYKLSWEGGDGATYRLTEVDGSGASIVLYEGPDVATTVSGRPEGVYHYRLEISGVGAGSCEVAVEPPAAPLVAGLFSAGLVVTAATVILVLRGHRRAAREAR